MLIDDAQVDRVLVFWLVPQCGLAGAGHVDALAQGLDHLVGQQCLCHIGARGRIGNQRVTVVIAQFGRFGMQVDTVGIRQIGQIEPFEDLQDQQRRQPLPVRRTFMDLEAPIGGTDRLHPIGPIRSLGKILDRVQSAKAAQISDHAFGDPALVERIRATRCNFAQARTQQRLRNDIARIGHLAARQEHRRRTGIARHRIPALCPVLRHARCHTEPVLRVTNGARKQLLQWQ